MKIGEKKKQAVAEESRWRFLVEAAKALSSQAVKAEPTSLAVIDEKGGELGYKIVLGDISEEVKKLRIRLGQGIVGWVAREGKPAMVNDVTTDGRFSGFIDDLTGFTSRSILCVPLLRKDIVRGVLAARDERRGVW